MVAIVGQTDRSAMGGSYQQEADLLSLLQGCGGRLCADGQRVDAALLTGAVRGALAHGDSRTAATRAAVHSELECDGYLYRFHQDQRPLGAAEGFFVLCGLIAALAAYQSGDETGAARWFERNRTACGSPGFYTEEYDVGQRQAGQPASGVRACAAGSRR